MGGQALCVKVQIKIKKCETLSRRSEWIYILHFFFLRPKKNNAEAQPSDQRENKFAF